MRLHLNSRIILFKDLVGDQYGLKSIPQDSIGNFLDVGAAYGIFTLLARLLHPNMYIRAIEPHPDTYEDLINNVSRMRVDVSNLALGDGGMFYLEKERKTRLCNSFTSEKRDTTAIQSYPLNVLAKDMDINDLAVKIDVEGAEWCMINHPQSEDILKRAKLIAIEVHETSEDKSIHDFYAWLTNLLPRTHRIIMDNWAPGVIKAIRR